MIFVYQFNCITVFLTLGAQYSRGAICRTNFFQGPNLLGPICRNNIFQGPNLLGPNLPQKITRGPICRGLICLELLNATVLTLVIKILIRQEEEISNCDCTTSQRSREGGFPPEVGEWCNITKAPFCVWGEWGYWCWKRKVRERRGGLIALLASEQSWDGEEQVASRELPEQEIPMSTWSGRRRPVDRRQVHQQRLKSTSRSQPGMSWSWNLPQKMFHLDLCYP